MLEAEDYDALAAFRYAMRKFLRFSKEALSESGLTPEQYEALLAIRSAKSGPNIRALSERLQVKHHTVVSLLNKLAERKLIARIRASEDRRQVHVKLTPVGLTTLERMAAIHRREIRQRSRELIEALRRLEK
jgi:DNA-binding MarR family transcriptional regulator